MVSAVAQVHQPYDVAGLPRPNGAAQRLEPIDHHVIDRDEHVAVTQPGALGRAARDHMGQARAIGALPTTTDSEERAGRSGLS